MCCSESGRTLRILEGVFDQERGHQTCDLIVLLVEREMAGLEQMYFSIRQIALVRLCPRGDKRGIVPSPDHQGRRLVLPQPCLPCRIGRDIRPVVVEQICLDLALAAAIDPVGAIRR